MMSLVSQASFSDAHESLSIPLIAANIHRLIRPDQSQIWAVLRSDADEHRINYVLSSGFLGRLCLSGDIIDLSDERWEQALEAVRFYDEVKHIIRDGFTDVIETTVKDYSDPSGYQIVRRVLKDEALFVIHTFKEGSNPPAAVLLNGYQIKKRFGSETDADFRGQVIWAEKANAQGV